MTIATLMATSAIFLVRGWTAPAFGALAITIGGIVCIAASNAGDTSQDLKTGYLIGATPWKQQAAVMAGVIISVFSIGATLNAMNSGLGIFHAPPRAHPLHLRPPRRRRPGQGPLPPRPHPAHRQADGTHQTLTDTHRYTLLNSIGSSTLADGKYLLDPATHQIVIQWTQGIGSEKAAAPQGKLMATVINGILTRKLPWGLVLLGVALVLCRRAPRRPLPHLRRRRLPLDRHHPRHLRRRRHALDGRPRPPSPPRPPGRRRLPGLARPLAHRPPSLPHRSTPPSTPPTPTTSTPPTASPSLPLSPRRSTSNPKSPPVASTPPASSPPEASSASSASSSSFTRPPPSAPSPASPPTTPSTTTGSASSCSPSSPSASTSSPASPSKQANNDRRFSVRPPSSVLVC